MAMIKKEKESSLLSNNLQAMKDHLLVLLSQQHLEKALNYLYSATSALKSAEQYESKFALELTYLIQLAKMNHLNKIHLYSEFLQEIVTFVKKLSTPKKNQFCAYVLEQTLALGNLLPPGDHVIELYKYAVDFFMETASALANNLTFHIGDLLEKRKLFSNALHFYKNVFLNSYVLVSRPDYSLTDDVSELSYLIKALKKCSREYDNNNSIYQLLIDLLEKDDPTKLDAIITNIKKNEHGDYAFLQSIFYLGNALHGINRLIKDNSKTLLNIRRQFQTTFTPFLKSLGEQISIFTAIDNNEVARAAKLIAAKIDLAIHKKHNPLQYALLKGNFDIAKLLLDSGVDPNTTDHVDVLPPLYLAIKSGELSLVDLVVKSGAKVYSDTKLESPLFIAIKMELLDIARLLLNQGATLKNEETKLLSDTAHPQHNIYQLFYNNNILFKSYAPKKEKTQLRSYLVKLAGGDESRKTIVFCPHAIDGFFKSYVPFATQLAKIDDGRPIYGIVAPPLMKGSSITRLPPTLEEMAQLYIDIVRTLQPMGPYIFVGWSFGGLLVRAMQQLLKEQNEHVLAYYIDSTAPMIVQNLSSKEYAEHLLVVEKRFSDSWSKRLKPEDYQTPTLETLSALSSKEEQINAVIPNIDNKDVTYESLQSFVSVLKHTLMLTLKYKPAISSDHEKELPMTFINMEESVNKHGPFLGWQTETNLSKIDSQNHAWSLYATDKGFAHVIANTNHFSFMEMKSDTPGIIADICKQNKWFLQADLLKMKQQLDIQLFKSFRLMESYTKYLDFKSRVILGSEDSFMNEVIERKVSKMSYFFDNKKNQAKEKQNVSLKDTPEIPKNHT